MDATIIAAETTQPFIRPYNAATDLESIIYVFRETADVAVQPEPDWTIASYIWAHSYAALSPASCFVLDSGDGIPVGYILGTPDTAAFVAKWNKEYIPLLDPARFPRPAKDGPVPSWDTDQPASLLKILYEPEEKLHVGFPGLVAQFPAHLHVDILPPWQRKGYGRRLMKEFCRTVKAQGAKGLHLGMVESNEGAEMYYHKMGFTRYGEVMDGGASREPGRANGTKFFVKRLDECSSHGSATKHALYHGNHVPVGSIL